MRVKGGTVTRRRHKKVLKLAQGFRGRRNNCYKHAKLGVIKALQYATRDRRVKKREFRALWIVRINSAARENGLTYRSFMCGLKKANIVLNRKVLADMAVNDMASFGTIVQAAKAALG